MKKKLALIFTNLHVQAEPVHIFGRAELPTVDARQVLGLVCVPWAS